MTKTKIILLLLLITMLNSCQAIGQIFSAGIWVGITIVVIVIIILFAVFRKRN